MPAAMGLSFSYTAKGDALYRNRSEDAESLLYVSSVLVPPTVVAAAVCSLH